jgi:predicted PurR-regulated permease PerM
MKTGTASSDAQWKQITLFLLTLGVFVACGLILKPFFGALVAAIVLAVVTQRPYQWLQTKISGPSKSAIVALLLILLILVTPIYLLAQSLTSQAIDVISSLRSESTQVKIAGYFDRHPALAVKINAVTNALDLENSFKSIAAFLGGKFAGFIGSSFSAITQIVVMLFILFFLYRDQKLAVSFVRSLLPLEPHESDRMISRVSDTIYATALGRLAIAGVQGALAGLSYWALGVPNHLFWAILTGAMSLVPAFGAFLVWVPIALYLGFNGHWGKAAILAVWGGGIVSLIDNLLYPVLIGPRLRQHTVAVLLSILGGISLFGVTGLVLGPVSFTVAATLLEIWRARNSPESVI